MKRKTSYSYSETQNICNMDKVATIELHRSEKTGKYYADFIIHIPDRLDIHQGWRETKEIFPDEVKYLINYFLEKEATGKGNAHCRI